MQEWDLVCDRKGMVKLMQQVTFFGLLCGVFISGIISDKYSSSSFNHTSTQPLCMQCKHEIYCSQGRKGHHDFEEVVRPMVLMLIQMAFESTLQK